MVDKVTGTQEYFLVGRWIEQAKGLADNADEFTKELYEFNARSLITTYLLALGLQYNSLIHLYLIHLNLIH